MKYILGFYAFLLSSVVALSGLHFETSIREITVEPDSEVVEVLFPFRNTSKRIIEIRKYDAPCSCMSAKLKGGKQTESGGLAFLPGEKGVIKGVFELGNFKGTVEKGIKIWTSEDPSSAPSIHLITRVTIPALIRAIPSSLMWQVGEKPTTKTIRIKIAEEASLQIIGHECSNTIIQYQVETIEKGREYLVTVTPSRTDEVVFAGLRFTTNSDLDRFKTLQTFITIKPDRK